MFTAMNRIRVRLLDVVRDAARRRSGRARADRHRAQPDPRPRAGDHARDLSRGSGGEEPQRRAAGHHRAVRGQHRPRAAQSRWASIESSLYPPAPAPAGRRRRAAPTSPSTSIGSAARCSAPNKTIHDLLDLARNRPPRRQRDRARASWSTARREAALLPAAVTRARSPSRPTSRSTSIPIRSGRSWSTCSRTPRRRCRARAASGSTAERPRRTAARACASATTAPASRPRPAHRIFEALFTTKAKGSGLGLALCRRIMEAHGGSIELEPSPSRRELRSRPSRARPSRQPTHERTRPDRRRRRGAGRERRRDRRRASASRRPSRAIARARWRWRPAHDFDVALIDVRLPDGDGMSLLGAAARPLAVHRSWCWSPATRRIEGAIAAVRGDAFAYVLKPVSPPDLLDTVRRALEQAALYRERERLRARARALRAPPPRAGRVRCRPSCWPSTSAGAISDLEPRSSNG